jgi:polysaccharide export outer membrane protein
MPVIRRLIPSRRAALRRAWCGALLVGATACATRQPETGMPIVPVAPNVVWRIEEGDLIRVKVYGQADLTSDPIVNPNGTAFFPGIGRLPVTGLSLDSLEAVLTAHYAKLIRGPAVQVSMAREITMYGSVRTPGVYAADPGATLLGLMVRAGGQATTGSTPEMRLEKADGRRFLMPREARVGSIDIHRNDAVLLADPSFFQRNATAIGATSLVVTTLSTMIGLILLVSR